MQALLNSIPDPTLTRLESEVGELKGQYREIGEQLEGLDLGADRDTAELHDKINEIVRGQAELQQALKFQAEQHQAELARIDQNIANLKEEFDRQSGFISELRTAIAQDPHNSHEDLELERLVSDVENTRRIMFELRDEASAQRDKVENLTAVVAENQAAISELPSQLERMIPEGIVETLVGPQSTNVAETPWWVDDESEDVEEEDELEGDEEEEDDNVLRVRPAPSPRVFPGARFYCARQGCVFFDGSHRAWYHEHKAMAHMYSTGHLVEKV